MPHDEPAPHVDPELLALLALGEDVDAGQLGHFDDCPGCRAALEELRNTVAVARSGLGTETLAQPAPRVWEAVAGELGLDLPHPPLVLATAEVSPRAAGPEAIAVGEHAVRRRPRLLRRRVVAAALATVVAGALVITGVFALRGPSTQVLASAELDALPAWTGSHGEAVVEKTGGDKRDLRVTVDASDGAGYREVWLLTKDAKSLVSLGVLDGTTGVFPLPSDLDLSEYDVVDISLEPTDGDPNHSGDSIVRGTLS